MYGPNLTQVGRRKQVEYDSATMDNVRAVMRFGRAAAGRHLDR
ncbi:MAG: hypothetical protein ABIR94_16715 [Rubrivivax sp.]